MTPDMLEKARANAEKNATENVAFRLGEIEHLPVADASVDVVISNCVINLSSNKPQVFAEAYRVLHPGGRLVGSDVVMTAALPDSVMGDSDSISVCVAGASMVDILEEMLTTSGFVDASIDSKEDSEEFIQDRALINLSEMERLNRLLTNRE